MKDTHEIFAKGVTVHCANMTVHINGAGEIFTSEDNDFQPRIRAMWMGQNQPRLFFDTFLKSALPNPAVEHQSEGQSKGSHLLNKICEDELSGVLSWAVEGLAKLVRAGGFPTLSEGSQVA